MENNYKKGEPSNRLFAFLLDILVAVITAIPGGFVSYIGHTIWREYYCNIGDCNEFIGIQIQNIGSFFTGLGIACAFLFPITYWVVKDCLNNGQSIGKKRNGLQVIHLGGKKMNVGICILRNIIWLICLLPYLGVIIFGVECGLILFYSNGRRIGDILANTMVIDISKSIQNS